MKRLLLTTVTAIAALAPAAVLTTGCDENGRLARMAEEEVPLKSLGLRNETRDNVLAELRRIYGID